ncbi:MAG: prepilin-type N-terminal cleavage/methylation domain-containing protein [Candidatus Acidiferrum sp.]
MQSLVTTGSPGMPYPAGSHSMTQRRKRSQAGFSLIEVIIVVFVIFVLSAMAIILTQGTLQSYKANAARDGVVAQIRLARELAISKRRNVRIDFTLPNQIQTTVQYRLGETPGLALPPVYLNDADQGVNTGAQFYVFPGLPDTPMAFGNTSAINLSQPGGGGAWAVMFTTSGALVGTSALSGLDLIGNSNPVNASIFLGIPSNSGSARAITILGATGRVRTYSWDGSLWRE